MQNQLTHLLADNGLLFGGEFAGKLWGQLIYAVDELVHSFGSFIPGGYRIIFELALDSEHCAEAGRLDEDINQLRMLAYPTMVQIKLWEGEHGSFAQVKMDMLKTFAKLMATGTDMATFEEMTLQRVSLLRHICKAPLGYDKVKEVLHRYPKVITREQHVWLRDKIGVTNLAGALRMPFDCITPNHEEIKGELRCSVSGFPEGEQDLLAAVILIESVWSLVQSDLRRDDREIAVKYFGRDDETVRASSQAVDFAFQLIERGEVLHKLVKA